MSIALRRMIFSIRSVATGPGLTPTTRIPSLRLAPPIALVKAISAAFPVEPAK